MVTVNAESTLAAAAAAGAVPVATPRDSARRMKLLLCGAAVVLALGYLIFTGLQAGAVYYLTVGELEAKGAAAYGERVRVAGKVLEGSIERDGGRLTFTVVDNAALAEASPPGLLARLFPQPAAAAPASAAAAAAAGARQLRVAYRGVVPDVFSHDVDVVVEGTLTSGGVFEATTLLAKCPSKFEEAGKT